MSIDNKTSLLIPSQLPEFIRNNEDYQNFVSFIQAYYEWMESANVANSQITTANSFNQGATYASKNLLNYFDIDNTIDDFVDYFLKDFLPYFPKEALVDKRKAIKIAKQLYETKGTPASYQFLFRLLYNSDFDVFYTKDIVFKASAGLWYVSRSLKLATEDTNFLDIQNLRLFGEISKSIATVENSILDGNKMEVYISNIERLFESGEFVRVVDDNNQTVLFDGEPLRAKIVGQISQIRINPRNRGQLYDTGDPVILYGGLSSNNSIDGTAIVNQVTTGSIQRINVVTGGYGYRENPNTLISLFNAPGAIANVGGIDTTANSSISAVDLIPINQIVLSQNVPIGNASYSFFANNVSANANTAMIDAFTFLQFTAYPISSVVVNNGGGKVTTPSAEAISYIQTDVLGNNIDIRSMGILAPIQIVNPGTGYQVGDTIAFVGGGGYGAKANVTQVSGTGQIEVISYVQDGGFYPLGGIGYSKTSLPDVSVVSGTGTNASIVVPTILGDGATFSIITDDVGTVTSILVTDPGEDYVSAPQVSLRVQDIVVSNVSILNLPQKGDLVYQGANINAAVYKATVDSVSLLSLDNDPLLSKFNLRVFEYRSTPNTQLTITNDEKLYNLVLANTAFAANAFFTGSPEYDSRGIKTYGDGTAKATASFLNGLVIGQGQYLTSRGHPSSFEVLQSDVYNNYTYQITVEKEIARYRDVLLNMLHPSGLKLVGRYAMKSNNSLNYQGAEALQQGYTLYFYTNTSAANATMTTDSNTKSTNVVQFNNLGTGVNIANFIFANSTLSLVSQNGPYVRSEIVSIDPSTNTVTLKSNTWLTFPNVAQVLATSNTNTINITSLILDSYNVINNGIYSNTAYPLKDIVYVGDKVVIANNTSKEVQSIDFENGVITLTSNLTSNSNSLMTVIRTFSAGGSAPNAEQVVIFGPVGLQYFPELITEDGQTIITEDERIILLG